MDIKGQKKPQLDDQKEMKSFVEAIWYPGNKKGTRLNFRFTPNRKVKRPSLEKAGYPILPLPVTSVAFVFCFKWSWSPESNALLKALWRTSTGWTSFMLYFTSSWTSIKFLRHDFLNMNLCCADEMAKWLGRFVYTCFLMALSRFSNQTQLRLTGLCLSLTLGNSTAVSVFAIQVFSSSLRKHHGSGDSHCKYFANGRTSSSWQSPSLAVHSALKAHISLPYVFSLGVPWLVTSLYPLETSWSPSLVERVTTPRYT